VTAGPRGPMPLLCTQGCRAMPDGKRHRRHCENLAKRQWYARHRAVRFARRM